MWASTPRNAKEHMVHISEGPNHYANKPPLHNANFPPLSCRWMHLSISQSCPVYILWLLKRLSLFRLRKSSGRYVECRQVSALAIHLVGVGWGSASGNEWYSKKVVAHFSRKRIGMTGLFRVEDECYFASEMSFSFNRGAHEIWLQELLTRTSQKSRLLRG